MYPSPKTYTRQARRGVRFPFVAEIPSTLDPQESWRRMSRSARPPSILLESSRVSPFPASSAGGGRWSFVLADPSDRFRWEKDRVGDPFVQARRFLGASRPLPRPVGLPPFTGGMAGLLSYELKDRIERPRHRVRDTYDIPLMDFGLFDRGIAFDHAEGKVYAFVSLPAKPNRRKSYELCARELEEWTAEAGRRLEDDPAREAAAFSACLEEAGRIRPAEAGGRAERFRRMVRKAKRYIRQGDIFQANLSHCLSFGFEGSAFEIYRRVAALNPTAFGGYAEFGDYRIVCGSPERLVRVDHGTVSTRPIAGTRPRSSDRRLDRRYSEELLLSPKERAEHVMLIDLERNDLGRVCKYGTVKVDEMMTVEHYSHVRHIVSNVTGRLARGRDAFDVLKSVFPGGTITGAPKVRAMEIIGELERRSRGAYTGSLGYLGFDGGCDFNIVIRSLLVKGGRAYLDVGAGIVADSDPEREYRETLDKAEALLKVLQVRREPDPRFAAA